MPVIHHLVAPACPKSELALQLGMQVGGAALRAHRSPGPDPTLTLALTRALPRPFARHSPSDFGTDASPKTHHRWARYWAMAWVTAR